MPTNELDANSLHILLLKKQGSNTYAQGKLTDQENSVKCHSGSCYKVILKMLKLANKPHRTSILNEQDFQNLRVLSREGCS